VAKIHFYMVSSTKALVASDLLLQRLDKVGGNVMSFLTCKKTIFELSESDLRKIAREEFKQTRHHFRLGWSMTANNMPCRRCLISARIGLVTAKGTRFINRYLKPQKDNFMIDPSVEHRAKKLAEKASAMIRSQKKQPTSDRLLALEKSLMWDERVKELTKGLPIISLLEKLKEARSTLDRNHPECPSCGLCYGGFHIAAPTLEVKGLGTICQWCAKDYKKQGQARFLKRLEKPGGVAK
jgi:hypothetical protein